MKIFSSKKRVAAIGVVTAATLVGGGVAFAYWTAGGTGDGSASTGDSSSFRVTVGVDATATLSPGSGVQQTIPVTVYNDAVDAPTQRVTDVVVSIGDVMNGAVVKCAASNFKFEGVAAAGAPITADLDETLLPDGSTTFDVKIEMVNLPVDQEGCKNVTVPLTAVAS